MNALGQHDPGAACTPQELNLTLKAQWVRVLDVVLIGPLMFAGGVALSRSARPFWGTLLGACGLATIVFNARNWWLIRQATTRTREQQP